MSDRRLFVMQYLVSRLYNGGGSEKATLKAGEYEIRKNASVRQVLDTLLSEKR